MKFVRFAMQDLLRVVIQRRCLAVYPYNFIQLAPLADESIPEDGNRIRDQTGAPVTPARHVADTGNTPGLETGAPQLRDAQEVVGFRQPIERLSELLLI